MSATLEADFEEELKKPMEDPQTRIDLWDSDFFQSWFLERGYQLYQGLNTVDGTMAPIVPGPVAQTFPYAYLGGDYAEVVDQAPFCVSIDNENVFYAQDLEGRHLAIKLVKDDSDEYRILRFLHQQGVPDSEEDFQCIIPVLDLLPFRRYWFAIMPRWGDSVDCPEPQTIGEIFKMVHCLLKGLNFLHQHRIAHGDIKLGNTLVNHLGKVGFLDPQNPLRKKLRLQGSLTYAIFDFNISTMFPRTSSLRQCRLPYKKSWQGTPLLIPPDTWQGEFDFNPFAFDVCMLGITLCMHYQDLTRTVPMLAPFLDRMVTRNIALRFSASEALRFFEDHVYFQMTEEQLKARTPVRFRSGHYEVYDRWVGLDPAFVQQWAAYREPPIPLFTKILRFICQYEWTHFIMARIRRVFHWP